MDKHTVLSIILLLVAFALGFAISALVVDFSWECPACSFDGGEMVPVVNDNYFDVLVKQINSAEESIHIIMYSMKAYDSNNTVQQLEDALITAAGRGVDVKVILDQSEWSGKITSVSKNNEKAREYLEDGGVEVRFESMKETTHVKMILVDGEIVIIGSTNWTYSAFERNNEANVMIENKELAKYFENYFNFIWNS